MTSKSSKQIGLGAATRMCSREPKYFGGDETAAAVIAEMIQILNEVEGIHPSTLAAIQRRRQRPWLKASVMALLLALLIVVLAWWVI